MIMPGTNETKQGFHPRIGNEPQLAVICHSPRQVFETFKLQLEKLNLEVVEANQPNILRDLLYDRKVALIIVHMGRDLAQGCATCRSIRKHPNGLNVSIIAMVSDAVLDDYPLDCGADDVLPIPHSASEAKLRFRLALWNDDITGTQEIIKLGEMIVDPNAMSVRLKGAPVDLTYKEFSLLLYFLNNAGQAVSREQILLAVWGDEYYGGDRTVDIHVRRLRAKLPPLLEHLSTVHGVGYRFTYSSVENE